jgi:hypothetical protein
MNNEAHKEGERTASPWEYGARPVLRTIERKVFSRIRALICRNGQLLGMGGLEVKPTESGF